MKITNIKIWPVQEEKLKAYVSVVIDEAIMIRDIKIIKLEKGYLVAMPNKRLKDGTFMDITHPINVEARSILEKAVMAAYEESIKSK